MLFNIEYAYVIIVTKSVISVTMVTKSVNILQFQVEQANNFIFHFKDGLKTFTINMDERTYTCIKFQLDEMPYTHTIVAIKKWHMDAYEYCNIYYKKQTHLETYEGTINSVENPDEWEIHGQMEQIEVATPIEKHTARRLKKTRLLSHG